MPRPSLQTERKAQILSAMSRCVAKYGLHGATLEKVAKAAGLARALLRHNIGNREQLVDEFIDFYLQKSLEKTNALFDGLPAANRTHTLIDWLFDANYEDPESILIAEALIAAGAEDAILRQRMTEWTMAFVSRVELTLRQDFPSASSENLRASAAGIVGIYFNVASMSPLGDIPTLRAPSKQAALLLIESLDA